ncbi:MAG: hypothetical protein WCD67_16685, partial [Xanthobacteraceae bacterium]
DRYLKMKPIFTLFGLFALFSGTTPARSETQLPINELFPCEVVLHELIADLRKLRVAAKHATASVHTDDQQEQAASYNAAVRAYDEAITAATKKFERCP